MYVELTTEPIVSPSDLEIRIVYDERSLYFTLYSRPAKYHHYKCGSVKLDDSLQSKMDSIYQRLSRLAAIGETQSSNTERKLDDLGKQLWREFIPRELQHEYWRFKDCIKSVLITSDEPWVPWELVKPYRAQENRRNPEVDLFWCQRFAISRWLAGEGSTALELFAGIVQPVAPTENSLPGVEAEIAFIRQLSSLQSSMIVREPLNSCLKLLEYLRNQDFSVLHFACHGMFDASLPNDSMIKLSDDFLSPSNICVNFQELRPLIFINACYTGRLGFSLTGLGGWAKQLVLEAKVGFFIGAMWEVDDKLALQFAQIFYTALLRDTQTIAEAFREAREHTRKINPCNSTWLAYSLYAEPNGRFNNNKPNRLTKEQVIGLLEQIEQIINKYEGIPEKIEKRLLQHLSFAKESLQSLQSERDSKQLALDDIKKMAETIKRRQFIPPTSTIWERITPILQEMTTWFGVSNNFFS